MTAAQRFRKKPVEIEAVLFEGEHNVHDAARWCGGRAVVEVSPRDHSDVYVAVDIPTLEGTMRAQRGDWIIRGVKGEFYPCKPDIFDATYEPSAPPAVPARDEEALRATVRALVDNTLLALDVPDWLAPQQTDRLVAALRPFLSQRPSGDAVAWDGGIHDDAPATNGDPGPDHGGYGIGGFGFHG